MAGGSVRCWLHRIAEEDGNDQTQCQFERVALLRNSRPLTVPSVTQAAQVCIDAGAHGITVHPRPDERHIRKADVYELKEVIAGVEYNIEGNPFPEFMDMVRDARPDQCTLVPDEPHQRTSDHGWDLQRDGERLKPIVAELKALGIRVSLFMDPEPKNMVLAKALDADRVELYTESYASAFANGDVGRVFRQYADAARAARDVGLGVNAGHDLNLDNLGEFVTIPNILEVSIGHALIADAVFLGLENTVKAYLAVLGNR